jgi:hypothetical protein
MKVTIINEPDMREVAEILTKLRYNTKFWDEHYGANARNAKKQWEVKADAWIEKHVKEAAPITDPCWESKNEAR